MKNTALTVIYYQGFKSKKGKYQNNWPKLTLTTIIRNSKAKRKPGYISKKQKKFKSKKQLLMLKKRATQN